MGVLDKDNLRWQDFALCQGQATDDYFDGYEASPNYARVIDAGCLSCPVLKQCLSAGIENGETGVWGGVYLINGNVDAGRNAHKSPEVWEQIKKRISERGLE